MFINVCQKLQDLKGVTNGQ